MKRLHFFGFHLPHDRHRPNLYVRFRCLSADVAFGAQAHQASIVLPGLSAFDVMGVMNFELLGVGSAVFANPSGPFQHLKALILPPWVFKFFAVGHIEKTPATLRKK